MREPEFIIAFMHKHSKQHELASDTHIYRFYSMYVVISLSYSWLLLFSTVWCCSYSIYYNTRCLRCVCMCHWHQSRVDGRMNGKSFRPHFSTQFDRFFVVVVVASLVLEMKRGRALLFLANFTLESSSPFSGRQIEQQQYRIDFPSKSEDKHIVHLARQCSFYRWSGLCCVVLGALCALCTTAMGNLIFILLACRSCHSPHKL